jgi:hypothetical protein
MERSSPHPSVPPPGKSRLRRAEQEGPAYHWQPWHDGAWLCESRSGALYIVSEHGCSCADWHYRFEHGRGRCKHQYALGYRLASEGTALLLLGMALLEEEPGE